MTWAHFKEKLVGAIFFVYDKNWKSVLVVNGVILCFCIYGLMGMYALPIFQLSLSVHSLIHYLRPLQALQPPLPWLSLKDRYCKSGNFLK